MTLSWPSRFSASGLSVASVERLSPGDLPVLVAVVYPRRRHEMALPPKRQTSCEDASGIFGGHATILNDSLLESFKCYPCSAVTI